MHILIHSRKNTLHYNTYKLAFEGIIKNGHKITYSHIEGSKEYIYKEVMKHARKIKSDYIFFISLEDILGLNLIKNFFYLKKNNIPIYGIYYHYYYLNKISIKSILIALFLLISPLKKIYISDPNFLGSKLQKLLFRKLLFLPDVFSIKEMPKIDSQKKFNEKLGIKKGYILISALGRLDSKKNIEIFLISLSKISTFLKMHNVKIFLGGLTDKTIMKRNMESIKILKKNKILIISNKFISNKNFFSALQYSNAIWCVQNKFFGSSGVFTRAISIGSIPIVNSISTLGALCLKENFGYTISFKEDISEQIKKLIIFLETTKEVNLSKKRAFLWSKKCSQEKFIDILLKSFN